MSEYHTDAEYIFAADKERKIEVKSAYQKEMNEAPTSRQNKIGPRASRSEI